VRRLTAKARTLNLCGRACLDSKDKVDGDKDGRVTMKEFVNVYIQVMKDDEKKKPPAALIDMQEMLTKLEEGFKKEALAKQQQEAAAAN